MSIPMAPSSEIFIDDILKKSLIFKEKRLDLIGREKKNYVQTGEPDKIEFIKQTNCVIMCTTAQSSAKIQGSKMAACRHFE